MAKTKTKPASAAGNPNLTARLPEFDPGTGLGSSACADIAASLGLVLADSFLLFIKTLGVHWNVAGASFHGLHKLTEAQYAELFAAIDEIAERIRALGHKAPASAATYARMSRIVDADELIDTGQQVVMLVGDNGLICQTLRSALEIADDHDDIVTVDLLTRRLAAHEKHMWMLRMQMA